MPGSPHIILIPIFPSISLFMLSGADTTADPEDSPWHDADVDGTEKTLYQEIEQPKESG